MSRNKVVKILILLLVLTLIVIQTCRVGAMTIDQILGPGNESSDLTENTESNNTATNTNKTLPKTGTNENIIIGLMVICTVAGIYAFKKVKDYNM